MNSFLFKIRVSGNVKYFLVRAVSITKAMKMLIDKLEDTSGVTEIYYQGLIEVIQ